MSCLSVHGRTDSQTFSPPKWCYELSVSISGGCSAYYAINSKSRKTRLCETPASGGKCIATDFFYCSPPSAPPSTPPPP
eukprot:7386248-Prymnesium_polylepis.3